MEYIVNFEKILSEVFFCDCRSIHLNSFRFSRKKNKIKFANDNSHFSDARFVNSAPPVKTLSFSARRFRDFGRNDSAFNAFFSLRIGYGDIGGLCLRDNFDDSRSVHFASASSSV